MFTYHYCAQYQENDSRVVYWGGISTLSEKVKTMGSYGTLKTLIDPEHAHKLTITSLTLI